MPYFEYSKTVKNTEYYEILENLMKRWEYEIVEFKEAKGGYDTDKIGRYFSAISNEANLRQQQYGWLIFGVGEEQKTKTKKIVGTAYKKGDNSLLERFKYEISRDTTNGMTFYDIIEIFPVVNSKKYRVLMFKIPAAATGIPTDWKTNYYERAGESLVPLKQYKIDAIRSQERRDWSKRVLEQAGIEHLDKDAVALAREKYKEKMNQEHISEEVDAMNDEQFLTKLKLMINGKITHAGMLLLGNSDYDYMFQSAPSIMWRLYGADNMDRDYAIFKIPFINVVDKVFAKVRNLTYRYMPNQMTLFPMETEQYDSWLMRELLNNCIAHTNYQLGGRIYVNEFEDKLKFTNPGDFIPQKIENVLEASYSPPFYRNQLLAESMAAFHMIDTATLGIRRAYNIQKAKYFPMPDYNVSSGTQVEVTIYGKTLNDSYMHILYDHQDLDLQTVFLLDRIQKGLPVEKEDVDRLREQKLVEGRLTSLYLSASAAKSIDESTTYIKNKGFDDKYYKDLIVEYLKQYKKAKKKDIRELLWDKLPDALSDKQKEYKIGNLLSILKKNNIIDTDSTNQQRSYWILKQ
ncbi:MAG: putative DNA binding domain-containing protein [Muribaculaceae bacterium]|nr:putative DNA binding domain-containing protein [Roseburia sp.]MCM1492849.1 putative DNA binding domain-containing protein [Muribaculaceae bacterium]